MTDTLRSTRLGGVVFGLGLIAIALVAFLTRDFVAGQVVPKTFPARTALALAAATLMAVSGAAILWPRTRRWGAAAMALYFGLAVVVLMDGRVILRNLHEFGAYSGAAEEIALLVGALILWLQTGTMEPAHRERLIRGCRAVFGVCAILFGLAHFFYMNLTAPLVPKWLPPSGVFWGYATGVFQIAAGLAFLSGMQARLAAILLTAMYVGFGLLVHLPLLLAKPGDAFIRSENALNLALIGVAWIIADSLAKDADAD